jgi:hypothetical protein
MVVNVEFGYKCQNLLTWNYLQYLVVQNKIYHLELWQYKTNNLFSSNLHGTIVHYWLLQQAIVSSE